MPRAGSDMFFPTRLGLRALFFSPAQFGEIYFFLVGSPSDQNHFHSGQFRVKSKGELEEFLQFSELIWVFWDITIQQMTRFGILKTQEPQVNFRVGFWPNPAALLMPGSVSKKVYELNAKTNDVAIIIIFAEKK